MDGSPGASNGGGGGGGSSNGTHLDAWLTTKAISGEFQIEAGFDFLAAHADVQIGILQPDWRSVTARCHSCRREGQAEVETENVGWILRVEKVVAYVWRCPGCLRELARKTL